MKRQWLLDQLPGVMADDEFLVRFLGIFQEIADSVRGQADGFDRLLDTAVAPPEIVRYMGRWIGFTVDSSIPDDRMRSLVKAAGLLFPWRGTQLGLAGLIETVTGYTASIEDKGGVFAEGTAPPNDHHVIIRVGGTGAVTREQLIGLIEDELPVDVTYDLYVGGEGPTAAVPPPPPPPVAAPPPATPPSSVTANADEPVRRAEPPTEGESLSARVDRLLAAARGDAPPGAGSDEPGALPEQPPATPPATHTAPDPDQPDAKPRFSSWWEGWGDDAVRRTEPGDAANAADDDDDGST